MYKIPWDVVEKYSNDIAVQEVTFRVKCSKTHDYSNLFEAAAKYLKGHRPYILRSCHFGGDEAGNFLVLMVEPLGANSLKMHKKVMNESRDIIRRLEKKG